MKAYWTPRFGGVGFGIDRTFSSRKRVGARTDIDNVTNGRGETFDVKVLRLDLWRWHAWVTKDVRS
jgi:hypothetical protein